MLVNTSWLWLGSWLGFGRCGASPACFSAVLHHPIVGAVAGESLAEGIAVAAFIVRRGD